MWNVIKTDGVTDDFARSSHGKQGLEVQMSGTFRLQGYDNRFESYLRSLGFGDLELSMIKGYKENITIAEPVRPSKTWSMAIKTREKCLSNTELMLNQCRC